MAEFLWENLCFTLPKKTQRHGSSRKQRRFRRRVSLLLPPSQCPFCAVLFIIGRCPHVAANKVCHSMIIYSVHFAYTHKFYE